MFQIGTRVGPRDICTSRSLSLHAVSGSSHRNGRTMRHRWSGAGLRLKRWRGGFRPRDLRVKPERCCRTTSHWLYPSVSLTHASRSSFMGYAGTLLDSTFFQKGLPRDQISTLVEGFQFARVSSCSFRQSCGVFGGVPPSPAIRYRIPTLMATRDEGGKRVSGSSKQKVPHVLTIAGSDSGAGAGIQADLKACGALGVYCSTVITAVTAQNTIGVQGVHSVPESFIEEQLRSVLSDMEVDVVKTGMLPSIGVVKVLSHILKEFPVQALVVDPVMVSTSGDLLAGPSVLDGFREELFPMADIVTPNLKEASALLGGVQLETVADMRSAAKSIHALGPRTVLVKGGDLPDSSDAVDIFFDGENFHELSASRIKTRNTHGTGCTLASCIASEVAKGSSILQAVKIAKCFVETALDYSKELVIGNGPQGPFDHLFKLSSDGDSYKRHGFNPSDLFLYAVTDSGMNKKWGRSISDAVKAAIEGGATIIQLREKEAETRDFVEAAKTCKEISHSYGVPLLINDRVDVALAIDADGVHVGQSDMSARVARRLLGPEKIIGVSCKTPEQAQQAWSDGADYIGCGGVFPTTTKLNNPTVGFDGLETVCLASKLPVVAIGGIGLGNARAVMEIGVSNLKGVAVVSALFDRECIASETRKLHSLLTDAVSRLK